MCSRAPGDSLLESHFEFMWVRTPAESPGAGVIAASITPPMAAYHNEAPRSLSAVRFLSGMAAFLPPVVTDSLIAERPCLFPNLTLSSLERAVTMRFPIPRRIQRRSHLSSFPIRSPLNAVFSHTSAAFRPLSRALFLPLSCDVQFMLQIDRREREQEEARRRKVEHRVTRLRHRHRATCQFAASFDPGSSE